MQANIKGWFTALSTSLVGSMLCACGVSQQEVKPALISGVDLNAMDAKVRPQDNFHQFTNGNWLKNTPIPPEYGSYGSFTVLSEQAEQNLRAIIEQSSEAKNKQTGTLEQKIGDFYNSYMNEEQIESNGLKPIEADLKTINNIKNNTGLIRQFASMLRHGFATPLDFGVLPDFKDSSKYTFFLVQSGLGLPNRDYFLDQDNDRFVTIVKAYEIYINDMLSMAGQSNSAEAATKIIALERQIAKAHWSKTANRSLKKLYNPHDTDKLGDLSKNINWQTLLNELSASQLGYIVIGQPSYFKTLGSILDTTDLETWKSYLKLRVISGSAKYLPKKFSDRRFAFYGRTISGLKAQKERWRRGVDAVNGAMGEALGKIYVDRHFPPQAKVRMLEMVNNLLAEFAVGIDALEWMSEETKKEAHDKLNKFTVKIGYPDKWRDYSALSIDANDIAANVRHSSLFEFEHTMSKLGKPIDKDEWGMTPQTVNAYYNPTMNEIVFPAAILQPPFFNMEADDAVNYGGAGLVIGHEISHGFDDQGSTFDGDGNLRNWWTDADRARFKASTDKLVAQYNAFEPLEGTHINGELTLGENIGDLSGATVALNAYTRSLNGKEAPIIDGYSGTQRFFLGYARVWGNQYRDETLLRLLVSDPHSPAKYRVNGIVPNMNAFYQAFDVKPGDKHFLPEDQRVKVW